MGMSDHGRDVLENALARLTDHDLALAPRVIDEVKQARKRQHRAHVLKLRRARDAAQLEYELCCEKLGLSADPEEP
jgi:hypothetical protein